MRARLLAATVGMVVLATATPANASDPTHAQWARAAAVTMHTSAYRSFCVQHKGNDRYWREGFCTGDLAKHPDYGTVTAPPGYHVCYVRDSVRAGELARIALARGVQPRHNIPGC